MITDPGEIIGHRATGPIFLIVASRLVWTVVEDRRKGWRPWRKDAW